MPKVDIKKAQTDLFGEKPKEELVKQITEDESRVDICSIPGIGMMNNYEVEFKIKLGDNLVKNIYNISAYTEEGAFYFAFIKMAKDNHKTPKEMATVFFNNKGIYNIYGSATKNITTF